MSRGYRTKEGEGVVDRATQKVKTPANTSHKVGIVKGCTAAGTSGHKQKGRYYTTEREVQDIIRDGGRQNGVEITRSRNCGIHRLETQDETRDTCQASALAERYPVSQHKTMTVD